MSPNEVLQSLHQLKTWLDAFRPLPPTELQELLDDTCLAVAVRRMRRRAGV